ncbi:MAG: hypothetical protein NC299_06970 [Lachnospiraceae bacterium]|nr:hypothetical protein [Ruminococcus sp.]MCM1275096.1 hypothetical protein [Lachnospiraceae bacterium]
MRQYCPQCCKWYETNARFCPKCDVVIYTEDERIECTQDGDALDVITKEDIEELYQKGVKLRRIGTFAVIGGIAFPVIAGLAMTVFDIDNFTVFAIAAPFVLLAALIACAILKGQGNEYKKYAETYFQKRPVNNVFPKTPVNAVCCPYCKSEDVVKIDAFDRAGSVILVGLASGKIGKQWHCNDCKSDF